MPRLRLVEEGAFKGGYESLGLDIADPTSGRIERLIPTLDIHDLVVDEGRLVFVGVAGEQRLIAAIAFESSGTVWRWAELQPGWSGLAVAAGAVYAGLVDGWMVALATADGREIWRQCFSDLKWEFVGTRSGELKRAPTPFEGLLICDVSPNSVVGLKATNGERAWVWRCPGGICEGQLYGARYYTLYGANSAPGGSAARLAILDAHSGAVVSDFDLMRTLWALPRKIRRDVPKSPLLVGEGHIFTGSASGVVMAFDRERGRFVWSLQPKGAGSTAYDGSHFLAANGRLYYSDMSYRLYCLREASGA